MAGTHEGGEKAKKTIEERHGKDYYKKIGEEGGKKRAEKHSHEELSQMSKEAAKTNKERHGDKFYQEIGKKGGEAGGSRKGSESETESEGGESE
ncbi:MAG: hypothetical protein Tsb005_03050 [Gammaproteobacteria bacterium]